MRRYLLAILISAALAAVAQNTAYSPDPDWQPPSEAIARVNPLAEKRNLAAGGRKLFMRHCSECHGEDGRGIRNAADLQLQVVQEQSDGALYWKITNGNQRRGMPSFSSIPEMQRWQIVLYLRELAHNETVKAKGK